MPTSTKKLTLSRSLDVPFNKLVLSQSNVRRVKAGISIEDLAEDIARRTLLQGLAVRLQLDGEGQHTGMYEVPAGGRRYRALELLVNQKRLAKTAPIPCILRTEGLAEEDSLAENLQRAPLHPLDQFRAFRALRDKGRSEEDIAAAFFIGVNVVKQRLRLATVAEALLEVYAEDGMTLEQLTAFTVSADHARQEQVWQAVQHSPVKDPYYIRRALTETSVRAFDRRALFVGLQAYEQAGGYIQRDLFEQDQGGWLQDVGLLDRLVADRLEAESATVGTEGWKWVEAAVGFPHGHAHHLRALVGTPIPLTDEERTRHEGLIAEFDALAAAYADVQELPDDIDQRFGELEAALEPFQRRPVYYDPAEIARAGVFVSVGPEGDLVIDRGYVRPEDEPALVVDAEAGDQAAPALDATEGAEPADPPIQRAAVTLAGRPEPAEGDDDGTVNPLPDRLHSELTAYRTLALRDAVANNPHVAMTALLHKLCLEAFHYGSTTSCLGVAVRRVYFPIQPSDLDDSPPARAVADRHRAWQSDLPKDEAGLWQWLAALDEPSRAALLAHCLSFGVNALYEKGDRYGAGPTPFGIRQRLAQADRLARAVGLDMVEAGWRPTLDNYLGRVPKACILQAVREAKGEPSAQLIDHLKKDQMANEAERLLEGSGWLPEPLRANSITAPVAASVARESDLPAFLVEESPPADSGQGLDPVETEPLAAQ
jgi:ParB family chromosome partitioning protein